MIYIEVLTTRNRMDLYNWVNGRAHLRQRSVNLINASPLVVVIPKTTHIMNGKEWRKIRFPTVGQWSYTALMLAHKVSPPIEGTLTARRMLAKGGVALKVRSLC